MVSRSLLLLFSIFLSSFVFITGAYAQTTSYVNIVNPIRGDDFWEDPDQSPITAVKGQAELIKKYNLPVTWLLRMDAIKNKEITNFLKNQNLNQELGLFLEVTPEWTTEAGVEYRQSESWHLAGSIFLTGYEPFEREKLIRSAFEGFKSELGFYPKSVGAWWIDAYSLSLMQKEYGIDSAMIVADQFNTDNYQVWGQYFASPYYPTKNNTLFPAQNIENKIPVVISQWASRDPVNGYGSGVQESTYSLQVNDYEDFHDLGKEYFSKLIDVLTLQPLNQINQVVVGIENSYSWKTYKSGYDSQLQVLSQKRSEGQLKLTTMGDFATLYKATYPNISPTQVIVADDPLGTDQKAVWFMNPYHRVGWFFDNTGSRFRDIRPYNEGQEEPCLRVSCKEMKVTSYITRVLDDITYGKSLILDQGKISNFSVKRVGDRVRLSYQNEASRNREIDFMPRDISIDSSVRTIDGTILYADDIIDKTQQTLIDIKPGNYLQSQLSSLSLSLIKFIGFFILVILIPGFVLVRLSQVEVNGVSAFVSVCIGIVTVTLLSFILGYGKVDYLIYPVILIANLVFFLKGFHRDMNGYITQAVRNINIPLLILVLVGVLFQTLALVRSGWVYDFGMGFWGPLGHDMVWHQALINQLIKEVPPQNPIFSGVPLLNYHYFYDLLVALTYKLTSIPVVDLIYRFYPVLFSLMLGVGTYLLAKRLFASHLASLVSVYFVYFAGSFGWIVDYIKFGRFSGESAFWANQSISFNLNPPFAISVVLLTGIILWLQNILKNRTFIGGIILILMVGTLIEFKSYAGVVVLAALFLISLQQVVIEKSVYLFRVFIPSLVVSIAVFLPQNSGSQSFIVFSPFWFIHSMIDYTDRIGWLKLSQARQAYFERGDTLKYILSEGLGLFMFIVGNLGMRFMGLFGLIKWLFNPHKLDKSLIVYMTIISLALPVFFIQQGNSWNTIQFMYYGLYLMCLMSGYVVYLLYRSLPKVLGIGVLLLILILTPINSIDTFKNGFSARPPSRLSHDELESLSFLKRQPDGAVLTYPFDKNQRAKFRDPFKLLVYETTSYVSAFSEKALYIEDEIQHEIFLNDYKKRVVSAYDFFNRRDYKWSNQFLKDNHIKYVYLPKLYNTQLDMEKLNITKVFENSEALIYMVK